MKKITLFCLLLLSQFGSAQLPLEQFLVHEEFKNMIISPDGKRIAAIMGTPESEKVTILDLENMKSLSTFDFGKNRRVSKLSWVNKDYITMNVYKIVGNLDGKGRIEGVYLSKYNGKKRQYIYSGNGSMGNSAGLLRDHLPKEPRHILVNSYPGGGIKKHNIISGKSKSLACPAVHFNQKNAGYFIDKNLKVRGSFEYNNDLEYFFYYLPDETDQWSKLDLGKQDYEINFYPVGYSKNESEFYVLSNHESPLVALYLLNINTGELTLIYRHDYVDVINVIQDNDENVVGAVIYPDYKEIIWLDNNDPYVKLRQSLEASFPNQSVSVSSSTLDGLKHIVFVSSDKNAGEFYLYDTKAGKINYLSSARPQLKAKNLSTMKPFFMKARDGTNLHGYITLPKGLEAKDLPMIVLPHGGPHGPRDYWGFDSEVQLLANEGYAVLQVNFRGSGGYGQEFEESGYRKWGRAMQDDVTDATLWAVDKGYADKNRLCIYGGSYGGYAALQGTIREPDLYKCAVGYVGVYDLEKMKTCGDGIGQNASKIYLNRYIGDDKDELRANSPAYNVDKIKADLFIAHGKDDVRVPMCQANALTKALKKADKEYLLMVKDEGHGYQKLKNNRDFYTQMLEFFDKNIGTSN